MAIKLIRIAPVAYGYGPIGKALHIGRELRSRLGSDVQLELVAPEHFSVVCEPGLLDSVTAEPGAVHADVVVAVMNRVAAQAAAQRREPVIFVDSLAWLWDEPLPVADHCVRYLYQDLPFLPVPAANLAGLPGTRGIAAIGCSGRRVGRTPGGVYDPIVVSVAGVENFEVSVSAENAWYVRLLLKALGDVGSEDPGLAARTVVFGNRRALDWAGGVVAPMTLGSGLQSDFLDSALRARRVLASPGLTTLIELLPYGVPMSLLPPQNYSQVRIATALRCADVDLPQLPWDSPVVDWLATQRLPEKIGSQIVRNLVCERFFADGLNAAVLANLARTERPALSTADVHRLIGPINGAAEVAEVVADIL